MLEAVLSKEGVSLVFAELLKRLNLFSFSFINNSDVEPLVSLIKKFSINLLPCFTDCLKATGVWALAARFFEEEAGEMGGDSKANCNK